jgi:predicted Rossmann fold nucleotide-binding protein DprA/Smf involved in DNA uptake
MAAASAPDHRADCDSLDVQVLTALSDGPLQVDELAVRLGRPVGQILAQLTTLELFGEVERVPGMRFRRAA